MLSQEHRLLAISTPLGEDEVVLYKAEVTEELGTPGTIDVELLSEKDNIVLDDLLGQNVTIRLQMASGENRYFNGFVTQFHQLSNQGGLSRYGAIIRPWLWLLTLSENCRIFQQLSYPDILAQVFNDLGFDDFELQLSGDYPAQEYVVQYNETDFNFVSRMMEQEGIFYYFSHFDGKHTMIIVDDNSSLPDAGTVNYFPPENTDNQFNTEVISRWDNFKKVRSGGIRLTAYDFKAPTKDLESASSEPTTPSLSSLERFHYPGKYLERDHGNQYTRLLMEYENSCYEIKQAESNERTLFAGTLFTLNDHYREDQNQNYLITKFSCVLRSDHFLTNESFDPSAIYSCQFSAISSNIPYRPRPTTKKPRMTGPQTAMVVGPAGEEIWTDKYSRIKVLFHWDRYAQGDENSSCWIRVAQTWAGKSWGHIQIPRIGQEVLVDFLAGDPDRPIVIGSVYNGSAMPPYNLPANATQSGIKSRSSKGGNGANFNEIRFEDKKGSEEVYFHAEKDQNTVVENNRGQSIGNDHQESIGNNKAVEVGNNHTESIGNNMSVDVGNNHSESIGNNTDLTVGNNHSESVGSNMTIKVGKNLTESVAINYMENVGAMMSVVVGVNQNVNIGKNQSTDVGANQKLNVGKEQSTKVGKNQDINIGKNQSISIGENRTVETAKDENIKVGKNLVIDVGDAITIKCGKASITMKKDGNITVKGKDIALKASGKTDIKASKNVTIKGKKVLAN